MPPATHLRPDAAVAERCALIEAEKACYPVGWMCGLLGVPRSSYYAWAARARTVTASTARRRLLGSAVDEVFSASRRTYGCRRVAAALNRAGTACSVGLVAALMREQGLVAVQSRAWRRTTVRDPRAAAVPDLLGRDLAPAQRPRRGPHRVIGPCSWAPGTAGSTARVLATAALPAARPVGSRRLVSDITYLHTGGGWL